MTSPVQSLPSPALAVPAVITDAVAALGSHHRGQQVMAAILTLWDAGFTGLDLAQRPHALALIHALQDRPQTVRLAIVAALCHPDAPRA